MSAMNPTESETQMHEAIGKMLLEMREKEVQSRTKTAAARLLMDEGWTFEEVSAVLSGKDAAPGLPVIDLQQSGFGRVQTGMVNASAVGQELPD